MTHVVLLILQTTADLEPKWDPRLEKLTKY